MVKIIATFGVVALLMAVACKSKVTDIETQKAEIFKVEKAFEKMAVDSGFALAFYHYAAENAVIKRENDSLITGKENILHYYQNSIDSNATVTWTADYIDLSADGSMAYTFGKYHWKSLDEKGQPIEYKGIFHTVWKKQPDGTWKYVWD